MNVLEIDGVVHYELRVHGIQSNSMDREAPSDTEYSASFLTDIFNEKLMKIIGISSKPAKVYFTRFYYDHLVSALRDGKSIFVAFDTRCRFAKIASVIPSITAVSEPVAEDLVNDEA